MNACAMQTFNNVSQDVWKCLKESLGKHQIIIDKYAGEAEAHGVHASWKYNPAASILQIQVTKTPFFVTCSTVNKYIHDAVDKCYGDHGLAVTKIIV